jgi:DNA-binding NtrC family response regulator
VSLNVFKVNIPNDEKNAESLRESSSTLNSDYKNIMIVDDEPDILNLFSDYLQMKGFNVRTFEDPIQALSEIKLNHTSYDVIISDIRMPQMTGIELVKMVNKIDSKIKVIFMTAFDLKNDNIEQIEKAEFLTKPVKLDNLKESIIRILESQGQN